MKKAIYWFRKNLRINDNPSLYNAINENDEVILFFSIIHFVKTAYKHTHSWIFKKKTSLFVHEIPK